MSDKVEVRLEQQFGASVTITSLGRTIKALVGSKERGRLSLVLWGPVGIGKTSVTRQIAASLGIGYRRYDLPTTDYIQLGGVPELLPDSKGNKKAVRYPILDIPSEGDGIFVLDDFTHAPQYTQNLALDLALEHRLNDAVLGQGWILILCANDTGNVFPMPPAVANRMLHFYVSPDYASFRAWALRAKLRNEIIGYIDTRKEFLYQEPLKQEKAFPTPRTWEKLSVALDMTFGRENALDGDEPESGIPDISDPEKKQPRASGIPLEHEGLGIVSNLAASAVGAAAAADLVAYLNTYSMVNFQNILNKTHAPLSEVAKALKGKHEVATCQALEYAVVAQARSWWNTRSRVKKIPRAKALGNILHYLSAPFRGLLIRDFAFVDGTRLSQVMTEVRNNPELAFVEKLFSDLGAVMSGKSLE